MQAFCVCTHTCTHTHTYIHTHSHTLTHKHIAGGGGGLDSAGVVELLGAAGGTSCETVASTLASAAVALVSVCLRLGPLCLLAGVHTHSCRALATGRRHRPIVPARPRCSFPALCCTRLVVAMRRAASCLFGALHTNAFYGTVCRGARTTSLSSSCAWPADERGLCFSVGTGGVHRLCGGRACTGRAGGRLLP